VASISATARQVRRACQTCKAIKHRINNSAHGDEAGLEEINEQPRQGRMVTGHGSKHACFWLLNRVHISQHVAKLRLYWRTSDTPEHPLNRPMPRETERKQVAVGSDLSTHHRLARGVQSALIAPPLRGSPGAPKNFGTLDVFIRARRMITPAHPASRDQISPSCCPAEEPSGPCPPRGQVSRAHRSVSSPLRSHQWPTRRPPG
jgi:hypothetical protein